MITGAHTIIYSRNADADRAFLKDVLGFPYVDVGHGWLIFGLPPGEVAIHPAEQDSHELYLITDDVAALVDAMQARGYACAPLAQQAWGLATSVTMPGGSKLGIYEPRHARPPVHVVETTRKKKGSGKAEPKKAAPAKKTQKAAPAKKTPATARPKSKSKPKSTKR